MHGSSTALAIRIDTEVPPGIDEFIDNGVVSEVLSTIKSGKEATAYLVRGTKKLGTRFAVAKVYHERNRRNVRDSSVYTQGRVIGNGQVRRAIEKKTETGREFEGAIWVDHEFEVLSALEYAGADVPEVYFANENSILMAHVGDRDGNPAPQLQHVELARDEASQVLDRLLWNVELWLANDVVHGDLSGFNILYSGGQVTVIDFPQAVDPRFAPAARNLLERDLANLGRYFSRYGIEFDASRHTSLLWGRFRYGGRALRHE